MSTSTKGLVPGEPKSQPADAAEQHGNSGRDYSHLKPYQFKSGQSGNPAGRPPGRGKILQHLQNKLAENDDELAKKVVARLFDILLNGDDSVSLKAIKEWLDRIEGLPIKRIEISETRHEKLVVLDDEEAGDEDESDQEPERVGTA